MHFLLLLLCNYLRIKHVESWVDKIFPGAEIAEQSSCVLLILVF